MFEYEFMRHALIAMLLTALIAGPVGYLILMRRLSFAAHTLGHISFTGAALALLVGFSPILGQFFATTLAAVLIAWMGNAVQRRDIAIAIVSGLMLSLGMLCLHYTSGSSRAATSLLFGEVLSVSKNQLVFMSSTVAITIVVLGFLLRPLVFASLTPALAEAKGVPTRWVGLLFMVLVALTVTLVNQIVGALLVFVLLIGPAAISARLSKSFWMGIFGSIAWGIFLSVLALVAAFYLNWPVSVCLTIEVFFAYLAVSLMAEGH